MRPGQHFVALLLVEHEAMVCAYLTRLSPSDAPEDAEPGPLLAAHAGPLELVMGTMSMHFVTGSELAAVLESVHPPIPVFALSGRQWDRVLREGRFCESRALLKVPFDPEQVRARIGSLRTDPAAA